MSDARRRKRKSLEVVASSTVEIDADLVERDTAQRAWIASLPLLQDMRVHLPTRLHANSPSVVSMAAPLFESTAVGTSQNSRIRLSNVVSEDSET